MTDRKKPSRPPPFPDMPFGEALARLLQTDPEELAQAVDETRKKEEEVDRWIREQEEVIRRGGRRSKARFSL